VEEGKGTRGSLRGREVSVYREGEKEGGREEEEEAGGRRKTRQLCWLAQK
jgi:hypothetical protein